jgi:2-oxoglutarate ferredoxin oxidoreductase subunit alpha
VPLHEKEIAAVFAKAKKTIIVENNQSGQFARYLRGETGLTADGHIRKYDGEPFQPHHIVNGVNDHIANGTEQYIPYQEVVV